MKHFSKFIKSQKGFGLIGAIGAVACIAFAVLAVMQFSKASGDSSKRNVVHFRGDQIRKSILNYLSTPAVWQRTIADNTVNATMSCLTGGVCTPGTYPFRLLDPAGGVILDTITDPTTGYDLSGNVCNSVSPLGGFSAAGNPACPFQLNLTWSPLCPSGGGPCISPQVLVLGQMAYSPGGTTNLPISQKRFNFKIYLNAISGTQQLIAIDDELGGTPEPYFGGWITISFPPSQPQLDTIGTALSGGSFTLPAGTYLVDISVPGFQMGDKPNGFQAKLVNITDGVDALFGTPGSQFTRAGAQAHVVQSHILGTLTLIAPKIFSIQESGVVGGSAQMGHPANVGGDEVYTQMIVKKLD